MSSRLLVIAGIVGGILAGLAVCVGALALIAIDGAALNAQVMATLVLGVALGVALDATWLTLAVAQLAKLDRSDGDDGEGDEPRGGPGPDPAQPGPSDEGPNWWTEFERDFRAHLELDEDAPVAG